MVWRLMANPRNARSPETARKIARSARACPASARSPPDRRRSTSILARREPSVCYRSGADVEPVADRRAVECRLWRESVSPARIGEKTKAARQKEEEVPDERQKEEG